MEYGVRGKCSRSIRSGCVLPRSCANPTTTFPTEFYLVIDLAVGGTSGWFPDGVGGKMWYDGSASAFSLKRLCLDLTRAVIQLQCATLQQLRTHGVLRGLRVQTIVRLGCESRLVTVRFCADFVDSDYVKMWKLCGA